MTTGYMEAVNALGLMILEQNNKLKFKEYELESLRKELEELKKKIKEFELNA